MSVAPAVLTLFLIMDPLGNVPLFLTVLRAVPAERRRIVLVREVLLAYVVLLAFLIGGGALTRYLHLQPETISVAGGIVLFLIALRMIFPSEHGLVGEAIDGEPLLVPLAIPLFAGPSTLAALLLLRQSASFGALLAATSIAWALSAAILLASTFFYRVLRERGLMAMERLMGMLLVMVAVQMLMDGIRVFLGRS